MDLHQGGALSYHSAGSAGSTAEASHRARDHAKEGHSFGRAGSDNPCGCDPGSHKGCRWDISADV